ncbi:MAG TPA: hypothetical protein VM166_12900 [Gemmatimonadaceae bacterium]|nr:hypothetical protein [Gemmatimonadaceae bacterium]
MAQLNHRQYDMLENAITRGKKIAAFRRGTEYIVVPTRLRVVSGREAVDATHPTTGEKMTIYLDELDSFEVVR